MELSYKIVPNMFIIDFFRKRSLKKNESKIETSIKTLESIKSAVAFIDVEDSSFSSCKNEILSFYRENGIKGDIFFFDFRKLSDTERLITSINTTILRKDLNFYGRPSQEKISLMLEQKPDLFISLVNKDDFPIEYMAKCCEAGFKIGRKQLPGGVFDMVFSGTESEDGVPTPEYDIFLRMKELLQKIK